MADERAPDDIQPIVTTPKKKKKKKGGFFTFLFWLILLSLGIGTGLHLSGIWDGRPIFWSIVPRIPYIGDRLAKFFSVPDRYAMSINARRTVELDEWQKRLDALERSIALSDEDREAKFDDREKTLTTVSRDLKLREMRISEREKALDDAEGNGATASERELMNQVARTYQDMSPRKAAAIVNQLRDNLAVELLLRLPNDVRASIMSTIRPQKASRLTELMSRGRGGNF